MTEGVVKHQKKFIPIRGYMTPETMIALDRLSKAKPGDVITYEELDEVCGCDVRKRRNVITTATKKLFSEQAMVFVVSRGIGIRLLHNEEIPSLGARDINRIARIAKRSSKTISATDYETLSDTAKVRHNTYLTILSMMQRGGATKTIKTIEEEVTKRTQPHPVRLEKASCRIAPWHFATYNDVALCTATYCTVSYRIGCTKERR